MSTITAIDRPPGPRRESVITVREFLDRMTIATYAALLAKAATDPVYAALRDYLLAGGDVHLDADATVQGLAYAVSEGDLTAGDVTRIRGL